MLARAGGALEPGRWSQGGSGRVRHAGASGPKARESARDPRPRHARATTRAFRAPPRCGAAARTPHPRRGSRSPAGQGRVGVHGGNTSEPNILIWADGGRHRSGQRVGADLLRWQALRRLRRERRCRRRSHQPRREVRVLVDSDRGDEGREVARFRALIAPWASTQRTVLERACLLSASSWHFDWSGVRAAADWPRWMEPKRAHDLGLDTDGRHRGGCCSRHRVHLKGDSGSRQCRLRDAALVRRQHRGEALRVRSGVAEQERVRRARLSQPLRGRNVGRRRRLHGGAQVRSDPFAHRGSIRCAATGTN